MSQRHHHSRRRQTRHPFGNCDAVTVAVVAASAVRCCAAVPPEETGVKGLAEVFSSNGAGQFRATDMARNASSFCCCCKTAVVAIDLKRVHNPSERGLKFPLAPLGFVSDFARKIPETAVLPPFGPLALHKLS
jgi:hypothetical protein